MKEDITNIHPNAESRMFNLDFKIEKRMAEDGETELTLISGVGAVLDAVTDLGWCREKINPNAFASCDMSDVLSCFNHDLNQILSRTTGRADDLTITIEGNQVKYSYAIKNECAEDVAENIALGFINGSSIMFTTKKDSWTTAKDGVEEREILEIDKLYELGPVAIPAYPTTSVAARSLASSKPEPKQITKDKYFYKKQLRQK